MSKRRPNAKRKGKPFVPKKQAANKGGRRYGPVPYGIFVDHATGFLRETFERAQGRALQAAATATRAFVAQQNTRINSSAGASVGSGG